MTYILLKKRRAKRQLCAEVQKGQKAACQRKSITVKKERMLTLGSIGCSYRRKG
jgi:hypothetical protein